MLAIWSLAPLPFLKPACISASSQFRLLKPGLENLEHYFTSMWDECNWPVVWTFFGVAFLWDWNENWGCGKTHLFLVGTQLERIPSLPCSLVCLCPSPAGGKLGQTGWMPLPAWPLQIFYMIFHPSSPISACCIQGNPAEDPDFPGEGLESQDGRNLGFWITTKIGY